MTIYLDIVFLENILMNYIILFAVSTIIKLKEKQIRLILSSLLGSLYAVLMLISNLPIYTTILGKILLSVCMMYIAFGSKNFKALLKQLLIFYLTSFAFGGCAFALLYFMKPEEIFYQNGLLVGYYPMKIALLGSLVGFIFIIVAFKNVKGKFSRKDMFCEVEISFYEKSINITSIIDTGNLLKEPITGLSVVVVEKDMLSSVIPQNILSNIEKIMGGELATDICNPDEIDNYISKFRLIPFSSLGKQNGMLLGFKPDSIKIYMDENEEIDVEGIVGIYDRSLSKTGLYNALIGLDILEDRRVIKSEYSRDIKV